MTTNKRINIVLPETTIQTIDRMARPGQRSRFIDRAVQHFVSHRSTEAIRNQLERAAVRDRDLDREIAADWFAVDKEAWQQLDTKEQGKAGHPRRAEVYLTALDPTIGMEIRKTRPALVIQNDVSNRLSGVTIVAPITSTVRFPLNPVHVLPAANRNTGLSVVSVAVFNQIRAVDRVRPIRRLGALDDETMERVDEALKISLGLLEM